MVRFLRRAVVAVPLLCAPALIVAPAPLAAERAASSEYPASVVRAPARAIPSVRMELPVGAPEGDVAPRILARLERIRSTLRTTRYQHRTRVRPRLGEYLWDCSGMVGWILQRDARRAYRGLHRSRPVARTFFRAIQNAPTAPGEQRRGWRQLPHLDQARPGDILAWLRPDDWPRGNTGHVAIVLSNPVPLPEWPAAYLVRVADSTRAPHQDDTRPPYREDAIGGYGEGTLLITTDGEGHGTGYGWYGRRSGWVIETPVVFGRLKR